MRAVFTMDRSRRPGTVYHPGMRPVRIPIEHTIDLHAFNPRDVASVVEEYVTAALAAGFAEVRIVHGRGRGVQRRIVRGVLARHPAIVDFNDAPDAHLGATVARLKVEDG